MDDAPQRSPSNRANIAFWVGLLNSGGLMLLGAYCLKGAVDHQLEASAAFMSGLFAFLGSLIGR